MISVLKMIKFNVASINTCTEVEGPYKRLCIWFQGCDIHCQGCCNPDYQPIVPKHILALDELLGIISQAQKEFGIEGVTYSGGEPTLQQGLSYLTQKIKELGLGVISFTGRKYEDVSDILCDCDLVLDGAYEQDTPEKERRLLGSVNQRILLLTDRYKNVVNWFKSTGTKAVEVHVGNIILSNGDAI